MKAAPDHISYDVLVEVCYLQHNDDGDITVYHLAINIRNIDVDCPHISNYITVNPLI